MYRHFDEAGLLWLEEYDFKGNLLRKNRQVFKDGNFIYTPPEPTDPNMVILGPDWQAAAFNPPLPVVPLF